MLGAPMIASSVLWDWKLLMATADTAVVVGGLTQLFF